MELLKLWAEGVDSGHHSDSAARSRWWYWWSSLQSGGSPTVSNTHKQRVQPQLRSPATKCRVSKDNISDYKNPGFWLVTFIKVNTAADWNVCRCKCRMHSKHFPLSTRLWRHQSEDVRQGWLRVAVLWWVWLVVWRLAAWWMLLWRSRLGPGWSNTILQTVTIPGLSNCDIDVHSYSKSSEKMPCSIYLLKAPNSVFTLLRIFQRHLSKMIWHVPQFQNDRT